MKDLDILNAYLQRFYPAHVTPGRPDSDDWSHWEMGWEYNGPESERRIFPYVLCADGFQMSVQGHHGAYSYPRDDFADRYLKFEVRAPYGDWSVKEAWNRHSKARPAERFDDEVQFPYVPLEVLLDVIDRHGGLFDWHTADLGVPVVIDATNSSMRLSAAGRAALQRRQDIEAQG